MADRKEIGNEGEDLAVKALEKKGYRILEKNYRTRFGEIDIIAEDKDCLVFVEVKRRSTGARGASFEAINFTKKLHMTRTAQFYLKKYNGRIQKARFDVVGIDGDKIRIIQHAFLVEEHITR